LRIAGCRSCAQVAHSRFTAAGIIACDQAEGEMRPHIATCGHPGEMGKGALVVLGCGTFEPLNGLRTVATDFRSFEEHEPQLVLG